MMIAYTRLQDELNLVFDGIVLSMAPGGEVTASLGDPGRKVHLRSMLKPIRGLLLVERLGLGGVDPSADLAVLVGSHDGLPMHRAAAAELLQRLDVSVSDVLCAAIPPQNQLEALRMDLAGESMDLLRHQCLGEHLGVLRMCRELGLDLNYGEVHHEVHTEAFAIVSDLGEANVTPVVDRCGMPTLLTTARGLAGCFVGLTERQSPAFALIQNCIAAYPDYFAGPGRFLTRLANYSDGRWLGKESASGGFLVWDRLTGRVVLSFCSSGEHAAAEAAIIGLLQSESLLGADFPLPQVAGQTVFPAQVAQV